MSDSVVKIRNAVRYVRSSPARFKKFKTCMEDEKISCKSMVCLDVHTRWNSTYVMLEAAEKFEKAFDRLEDHDSQYVKGPPSKEDWDNARNLVKFLGVFYEVTLRISGSLFVTSNQYFHELCLIKNVITEKDPLLSRMAKGMERKFNKYWGDFEKINSLLFVAIVLDPRYKLKFTKYCLSHFYEKEIVDEMVRFVDQTLRRLYDEYRLSSLGF
ncbi:hypothetical protein F511_41435 [Dorcoceras hygrometricum]|uniref:hAT-like transposase RNase-H fold domain-containing protein n=1 Tax=Dorcoceras hygrometricum TaxID=472368 RepID=A0A2Z7BWC4_9LAMI|nr:hypothetical protein F511_41435 [Dorcoceras hygrometricum]